MVAPKFEVYQQVRLKELGVPAYIIDKGSDSFLTVTYQVCYWWEGQKRREWVYHMEIE